MISDSAIVDQQEKRSDFVAGQSDDEAGGNDLQPVTSTSCGASILKARLQDTRTGLVRPLSWTAEQISSANGLEHRQQIAVR